MSRLHRYDRAFRYVRNLAQQHCESYTQFCLRTDVLVEAISKAKKYDELIKSSNPTFEQCIKEWEDRGWIVEKDEEVIDLINNQENKFIRIIIEDKEFFAGQRKDWLLLVKLSYEETNLLSKTLKALEELKDE